MLFPAFLIGFRIFGLELRLMTLSTILETRTTFFTQVSCVNDSAECCSG
jgi:hypothetical protein